MITVLTSPPQTRLSLTAAARRENPRVGDQAANDARPMEHVSEYSNTIG